MILKTNIATLAIGGAGVVAEIDGLDPVVLRLREMGLVEGSRVVLTRRAPFGDPLEIEVRGTRLCLRAQDAARFAVTPAPAPSPTSAAAGPARAPRAPR